MGADLDAENEESDDDSIEFVGVKKSGDAAQEIRSGLATMAGVYRDRLVEGVAGRRALDDAEAVARIHHALEALERNPNEPLLIQALLLALPALTG